MAKDTNEEILHTLADINEAIGTNFEKVWAEFTNVNRRLDGIDQRFIEVDQRLTGIDQQLAHVIERLNRIEEVILQEHARRIEALERQISATR